MNQRKETHDMPVSEPSSGNHPLYGCSGRPRLRLEILTDEQAAKLSPVPIFCDYCGDVGTIPADPIFVNTEHSYGVEYRGEAPCPKCGGER